jgi:hypothetical protein
MRDALSIVFRREHLRKTVRIALVVGCVLTLINQLDVFLGDKATTITFVKTGLNFCVPFIVSNLGLLAGKRAEQAGGVRSGRAESGILWNPEAGTTERIGDF